jgi:hypothetical protein
MPTNFKRTFGNATSPLALSYLDDNFSQLEAAGTSTVTLSGAQLVGFMQSGTGAVSRTAQEKMRDVVNAADFGTVQQAITALSAGQTLFVDDDYTLSAELSISSKTDIHITGGGSLTLSGAASDARIFKLVGTCDNIKITDLELVGEANAAYNQQAIGNASGQTISNVWFCRNKISSINVGITLNADTSGTYTKAHVLDNSISSLAGTDVGEGYGIHINKATQAVISGNVIDGATRHAIYHAGGTDTGNVIVANTIRNHRASVFDGNIRPAIYIARSSGVLVAYNTLENGYDAGMAIEQDTTNTADCYDIDVIGNTFRNRKNAVGHLYIGEQAVPGTYEVKHIRVKNNFFYTNYADANNAEMFVNNGRFIEISGNTFRKDGITGVARFITYGNNSYITDDDDFNHCSVEGNTFIAEGGTLTDVRAILVCSDVCTNTSYHRFHNTKHVNVTEFVYHDAEPTNPNMMAITEHRTFVHSAAGVADGTTAGKAKTTNAVRVTYRRLNVSKAATDDLWDLTGVSTTAGQFRKVLLCLDAGATARIVTGEVAASQAAAKMPRIPDDDWAALGVVEIGASYSGGDLAANTFYDIVGIYEQ